MQLGDEQANHILNRHCWVSLSDHQAFNVFEGTCDYGPASHTYITAGGPSTWSLKVGDTEINP